MEHCDKCKGKIENGKCPCGVWYKTIADSPSDIQIFEKAILEFNMTGRKISSGDHYTGTCFVFFKGDFDDCQVVNDFIERNILLRDF